MRTTQFLGHSRPQPRCRSVAGGTARRGLLPLVSAGTKEESGGRLSLQVEAEASRPMSLACCAGLVLIPPDSKGAPHMAKVISTLFISTDGVAEIDPDWYFPY